VYGYSNISISTNKYYHVIMTATPGGYLKLYVNGVDVTGPSYGGTLPNPLPNTSNPIQIGGATWASNYFAGKIPVTKVYNRVLTAGEIQTNYNHYKTRFNLS